LSAPPIDDTTTHDSAMDNAVACFKKLQQTLIFVSSVRWTDWRTLIGLREQSILGAIIRASISSEIKTRAAPC